MCGRVSSGPLGPGRIRKGCFEPCPPRAGRQRRLPEPRRDCALPSLARAIEGFRAPSPPSTLPTPPAAPRSTSSAECNAALRAFRSALFRAATNATSTPSRASTAKSRLLLERGLADRVARRRAVQFLRPSFRALVFLAEGPRGADPLRHVPNEETRASASRPRPASTCSCAGA